MSTWIDPADAESESVLEGGQANAGAVVRVGDTVRRPRGPGHVVEEAALVHLEQIGFEFAPRLLGIDAANRQVLTFIEGEVTATPSWQLDDAANAAALCDLAAVVRAAHDALATFEPPDGAKPVRPIPGPGQTWNHADVSYQNVVYRDGRVVGLIDWEFVSPGDPLYDIAGLVGLATRAPRMDRTDTDERIVATRLAYHAIADGFQATDAERDRLRFATASLLADAAEFFRSRNPETAEHLVWKSRWFNDFGHVLVD